MRDSKRMKRVLFFMTFWFVMMCWEVYDLHPEHVLWYSTWAFTWAYCCIHSTSPLHAVSAYRMRRQSRDAHMDWWAKPSV